MGLLFRASSELPSCSKKSLNALISSARRCERSLQLLVPNLKKRVPVYLGTTQHGKRAV